MHDKAKLTASLEEILADLNWKMESTPPSWVIEIDSGPFAELYDEEDISVIAVVYADGEVFISVGNDGASEVEWSGRLVNNNLPPEAIKDAAVNVVDAIWSILEFQEGVD